MLTKGTRLGDYEVQSQIGTGGMSEVYRARDRRLHRDVAVKTLLRQDPAARLSRICEVFVDWANLKARSEVRDGSSSLSGQPGSRSTPGRLEAGRT